jgi:glycosyltransferase involved in cell wall biosynthesis
MKGRYPVEYFHTPHIDKPLHEIYADINGYSGEFFPDEPDFFEWINAFIPIPPLMYEGRFIKGLLISQGVDKLVQTFPHIKEIFNLAAYTMWSSYPWAEHADIMLTCYDNPDYLAWYKAQHPEKADRVYLPLLDTDYTNEYTCAPKWVAEKDIDVLCVARMHDLKNLPNVARALKVYEQKYGHRLRATFVIGKDFDLNQTTLDAHERDQMRAIERALVHVSDYITFIPKAEYFTELQALYDRSKTYTLASLIEGKNRGIREALLHDVPVLAYEAHNQWARGRDVIFPDRCGVTVAYDDEAMADGWHFLLNETADWTPRKTTLNWMSRRFFVNMCLSEIPYYRQVLPEQWMAPDPISTLWLDCATWKNYEYSYYNFMYDAHPGLSNLQGLNTLLGTINYYCQKFSFPTLEALPAYEPPVKAVETD